MLQTGQTQQKGKFVNVKTTHRPWTRRIATFALVGIASLALIGADAALPRAALAQASGAQPDPAWDFGRGGSETADQPACYLPAPSITERKMYSLQRPSCFPYHVQ